MAPIGRARDEWYQNNPSISTRLTAGEKQRLRALLRSRGQDLAQWIRAMMARCAAERLPESQGDVKKVIPLEIADLAHKVLDGEGDRLMRSAAKITDPVVRAERRQEAAAYYDAAGWFADVIEQARYRRHLLDTGKRKPRHRYTAGREESEESHDSN